ncbi:MAG: amidohydrolase family protein, partial [Planctomycetes bacterium]|nr:amidohydrolase family protein [Planctomycetota bacterium]
LARDWGVTSFKFHLHTQRGPELFGTWEAQKKGGHFGFDDGTVYLAMEAVAALGAPGIISIHPENWGISRALKERFQRAGYQETRAWDEHSPHMGEAGHVRLYAYYARLLGCPLYIQHVSTPETVREIEIARSDGATIVGQTGAHYLTLDHDTYRINVPLRDRDTIAALWRLLAVSDPSCVGSDHVCHTAPPEQMRTGNVWADISGFASRVEAMLPMMLSEGVNKGRISLERLVEVCCANTARAFGLYPRKGSLEVGADADVVLVDLQRTERIRPEMILSSAGWSAWEGWEVTGWPVLTMLRGRVASRWPAGVPRAEILGEPRGCYLARKVGHARYPLDPVEAPAQAIA